METAGDGIRRDSGKLKIHLVPIAIIKAIAAVMTAAEASGKYEGENWRKGIHYSRVYNSLNRHMLEWAESRIIDPEFSLPHLWHAACNLSMLIDYEMNPEQYSSFNDMYFHTNRYPVSSESDELVSFNEALAKVKAKVDADRAKQFGGLYKQKDR